MKDNINAPLYTIAYIAILGNLIFNWGSFSGARSSIKGTVAVLVLSSLLGLSFLSMSKYNSIHTLLFTGVLSASGTYLGFDSDFYYREDALTKWIYGFFLVYSARAGI